MPFLRLSNDSRNDYDESDNTQRKNPFKESELVQDNPVIFNAAQPDDSADNVHFSQYQQQKQQNQQEQQKEFQSHREQYRDSIPNSYSPSHQAPSDSSHLLSEYLLSCICTPFRFCKGRKKQKDSVIFLSSKKKSKSKSTQSKKDNPLKTAKIKLIGNGPEDDEEYQEDFDNNLDWTNTGFSNHSPHFHSNLNTDTEIAQISSIDDPLQESDYAAMAELNNVMEVFAQSLKNLPERLNQLYLFIGLLGYGGNGFIGEAKNRMDGSLVAVKFLSQSCSGSQTRVSHPDFPRGIPLEAEIMRVVHDDNIVKLIDLFEDNIYFYIVMERVPNFTVRFNTNSSPPAESDSLKMQVLASTSSSSLNHSETSFPSDQILPSHHPYQEEKNKPLSLTSLNSFTASSLRSVKTPGAILSAVSHRFRRKPPEILKSISLSSTSFNPSAPFKSSSPPSNHVEPVPLAIETFNSTPLPQISSVHDPTNNTQSSATSPLVPSQLPSSQLKRPNLYPSDLAALLQIYGIIPLSYQKYIVKQLFSAHAALLSFSFVYLDYRPENILIDDNLKLKLVDFGMSARVNSSYLPRNEKEEKKSIYFERYGTLSMSAPEVIQNAYYSGPEADIWALGILVYMITTGGKIPWGEDVNVDTGWETSWQVQYNQIDDNGKDFFLFYYYFYLFFLYYSFSGSFLLKDCRNLLIVSTYQQTVCRFLHSDRFEPIKHVSARSQL